MELKSFIESIPPLWERLQSTDKPIVLYGMGNGAIKIINACENYGIKISEIFASDEFVRGHSFCGHKVLTLSQLSQLYDDFIILLGFGSSLSEVTDLFYQLDDKYELYAPDVPLVGEQGELFTKKYAMQHIDKLQQAYDLLADDTSRKVFQCVLEYKISGKISPLKQCETTREEAFSLINLSKQEVFLDLGAYDGDTVYEFARLAKSYGRIIALEPDPKNFKKLSRNIERQPIKNLTVINAPIWDCEQEVAFTVTASRNSGISDSGTAKVMAVTVDGILEGERVTYIKMDVEGAESKAIKGGAEAIKRYQPRLAISAYHRNEDLFSLAILIHKIAPKYKIYLRHHHYVPAWETNLYAINND